MFLARVVACIAVAAPVAASEPFIRAVDVEPSSATEHGIRVDFRTDEQPECPDVSVYVSVPRESEGLPATGVGIRVADPNGDPLLAGVLSLIDVDFGALRSGTTSEHPFHRRGGFHGVRLCVRDELLATTELTAEFGRQPHGVTRILYLGALSTWRSR